VSRFLAIHGARVDVIALADDFGVPGIKVGRHLMGLDEARAQVALGKALEAAITAAESLAREVLHERAEGELLTREQVQAGIANIRAGLEAGKPDTQ